VSNNLTDKSISTSEEGIDLEPDTDEATWHGIHKVIFISLHLSNFGENLFPADLPRLSIFADEARSDLYFIANL
jgi:hypothetical protein